MNCSNWKRDISAWLDGSLSPEKVKKVRLHLETCPDCTSFRAELSQVDEVFESARQVELNPPPFMWQRIQARIQEQEETLSSQSSRGGLLAGFGIPQLRYAIGASLLLLVTGVVAIRTRSPQSIDPESLTQLDSYTMEVSGNPFLIQSGEQNPFFGLSQQEPGNPFELGGVTQ